MGLKDGEIYVDLWNGSSIVKSTIMPRYVDMPDVLKVNNSFYTRVHTRYDSEFRVNYGRANEIQSIKVKDFI